LGPSSGSAFRGSSSSLPYSTHSKPKKNEIFNNKTHKRKIQTKYKPVLSLFAASFSLQTDFFQMCKKGLILDRVWTKQSVPTIKLQHSQAINPTNWQN